MEINGRKVHSFVVNIYDRNEDGILIKQVKALDENNKYIKFLNLDESVGLLSKYPVKFRDYDDE